MIRPNRRGFSIIAAIVGFAVLAVTASVLISAFSNQWKFFNKQNRKIQGDEVLAVSANALQTTNYDDLVALCNKVPANGNIANAGSALSGPVVGNCTVNNATQLNPAAAPTGNPTAVTLNILRTFEGDPSAQGQVCIELSRCNSLVSGRMIEITLKAYWVDPHTDGLSHPLSFKTITFRRTRW